MGTSRVLRIRHCGQSDAFHNAAHHHHRGPSGGVLANLDPEAETVARGPPVNLCRLDKTIHLIITRRRVTDCPCD